LTVVFPIRPKYQALIPSFSIGAINPEQTQNNPDFQSAQEHQEQFGRRGATGLAKYRDKQNDNAHPAEPMGQASPEQDSAGQDLRLGEAAEPDSARRSKASAS